MSTTTFSTTPTTDRPWVHDMVVVHRAFRRRDFGRSCRALVRRAVPGARRHRAGR